MNKLCTHENLQNTQVLVVESAENLKSGGNHPTLPQH